METFVLQHSLPKRSKGVLLVRWCVWFLFISSNYFIVETIWPGSLHSSKERLEQALISAALISVVVVAKLVQPSRPQSVTIDGDMIVIKRHGKFEKMFLGDIRTVVETKSNLLRDGGLMVSDKSLFKARLLGGFLWIPEESPDYAYLKSVVVMWAKPVR